MAVLRIWLIWKSLMWLCMAGNKYSTKTLRVDLGAVSAPSLAESAGVKEFSTTSLMPCTDCWITEAEVELTDARTSETIDRAKVYLDHVVFLNTGRKDGTCPSRFAGERFFVSGQNIVKVDVGTSADGNDRGYRVHPDDALAITGSVVNTAWQSRRVTLSIIWEFIPYDEVVKVQHVTPYWLDIKGCSISKTSSRISAALSFESPRYRMQSTGEMVGVVSHIQQGWSSLAIQHNGRVACELRPAHEKLDAVQPVAAARGHDPESLSTCTSTVSLSRNDTLQLAAHYTDPIDVPTSPIGGSFESGRGVALVYVAEGGPSPSGAVLLHESDDTEWWIIIGFLVLLSAVTLLMVAPGLDPIWRLVDEGLRT